MKLRAIVQKEIEFDVGQFYEICGEIINDYPNANDNELVQKSFEEVLYTFIEDYDYKIIEVKNEDKLKIQQALLWIIRTIQSDKISLDKIELN